MASSWVTTVMVMAGDRTEEDRQCPSEANCLVCGIDNRDDGK